MPGAYLVFIVVSALGVGLYAWRRLPGTISSRLLWPISAVLVVFLLVFDAVGSARGWFESVPEWVVAIVPPGIPPEEVLLLGFLALFSVVLLRLSRRVLGEADA